MVDVLYLLIFGSALLVAAGVFYYFAYLRDTPKNSLKKARRYHMLGEKSYADGKHEESKEYYELSKHYRQHAETKVKDVK